MTKRAHATLRPMGRTKGSASNTQTISNTRFDKRVVESKSDTLGASRSKDSRDAEAMPKH